MSRAWELFAVDAGSDWRSVDTFDDLASAAARIQSMEAAPVSGLFLEAYIDPSTSDAAALSAFEYTGQRYRYVIRRVLQ